MSFAVYDIILLFLFAVFVSIFLYSRKKNIRKEGLLILYKTSWGIKLINYVGKKYKKTLKILGYFSITLGYLLMAVMIYLFGKIIYFYILFPQIVREIKVPPIMPLIPYLPAVFKLDFLPPFYFTYWIIILAIVAVTHEFAHGIFAARDNIRIKTTGFGFFPFFLPVFLAAFVELDEKKMAKKSRYSQMSVLSAGTFTNLLTAGFFLIILGIFFSAMFIPSGVAFDTYAYSAVGISNISMINGIPLENPNYEKILNSISDEGLNEIIAKGGKNYVATKELLESQKNNNGYIILYDDAPAVKKGLKGPIIKINNVRITNSDILKEELSKHFIGEEIKVTTKIDGEILTYDIALEEHPEKPGEAWLGIGFVDKKSSGILGKVLIVISYFKKSNVYYEPKFDGASIFFYDLLWWLVLISVSVALINMLPVGIFDGGRFFYLAVLSLTKNEKMARKFFAFSTYLILFLLLLIMFFWAFSFFK